MTRAARPPTNKRRKLSESNRWLPTIKEDSRECGNGKEMAKVQGNHKQKTDSMLNITHIYVKEYIRDIPEAPYTSHQNFIQRGSTQARYRCSSSLMEKNLIDLLPSSKFHHVRKRSLRRFKRVATQTECSPLISQISERRSCGIELSTVCKMDGKHADNLVRNLKLQFPLYDEGCLAAERKITKAYSRKKHQQYFLNGKLKENSSENLINEQGSKMDPGADRGNYTEGAQTECSTPVSQKFVKRCAGIELSTVNGVDRKHADNKIHKFKIRFLDEGCLEVGRNISKAYGSQKCQEPHLKDGSPDLYALHILADAALSLGPEPIFHIEEQKGRQTSTQVDDEYETLSAKCENHASTISAKSIPEQASVAEASSLLHHDLQLEKLSIKGHVSGECQGSTSIDDQHTSNSENEHIDCQNLISSQTSTSAKLTNQEFIVNDVADLMQSQELNVKCADGSTCAPTKGSTSNDDQHTLASAKLRKLDFVANDAAELTCPRKLQSQEFSVKYAADLTHAPVKVSSSWGLLEPCNNLRENSRPKHFRSMEKKARSEEQPSSLNTDNLHHQSSGSRVTGIVQSSQQKAASLVDVSIKQVESASKIREMQHVSYPQNCGSIYHHQDLSCKPGDTAEADHSISAKDESSSVMDGGIPSKLISACVAALLMIQTCSDTRLPPAEAMEILEVATQELHPQCSQNLPIYKEIEELMCIIKTQVLTLVHTSSSNLQV